VPSPFVFESVGLCSKNLGASNSDIIKLGRSTSGHSYDDSVQKNYMKSVAEFNEIRRESYN
jgi:hypothetical protein